MTRSSGGGTKAASDGFPSRPPIQFCSSRTRPGRARSSPAISTAWIASRSSTVHRRRPVADRDRLLHRGHVRRDGPGAAPRRPGVDERAGQVERGDVVALDPGRRHGLRPQEQRADRLQAAHRGAVVERPDRRLGIGRAGRRPRTGRRG